MKQCDTLRDMKNPIRIAVQIETNRAHGRALLEGIADYALANTDWRLESVEPAALTSTANLKRFSGFIVRVMDDKTANTLIKSRKPVIDTYGRSDFGDIPFIRLDDAAIARLASECFVEHRYFRCAFCGFPGLRFSDARGTAFASAMAAQGATCDIYNGSRGRMKETSVRKERMDGVADADALRKWIRSLPKPIAVFCCNDIRAFHLLNACADENIDVPHDVSVLGVDNDKVLCTFSNPPLSSIDTNPFALGQKAASMLNGLISTPGTRPPAATLHKPRQIIERTSTEFFPTKTPWLSDALVYIRRHLGEGISADDVIAHLGYSHTTVGKAFRSEVGTSVQQEIIRQRRERACRLLKETSLTAAEIADKCGYPSAQYFAHVFSNTFGTTPDVWRR